MKRKLKSKKVFATITDLFIFSVFARVILYGCHQIGLGMQLSLLVGLLVGGIINYVLIPDCRQKTSRTRNLSLRRLFI
ncbi:hypothetical protein [Enterococcus avium]|uniref:hypothetical protein n=1 Tax=Enterococcus avium TaxID=33945 RepID=UPI00321C3138